MAKRNSTVIRNLVAVSDTHCGCRLGLFNPDAPVRLDDGGYYRASEFQTQMWGLWREFWDEWVPTVTRGEPYDILHNGDVIEGVHHHATTQVSQNIRDQKAIAVAALLPEVEKARAMGGRYFHIRGTAAHVGQSSIFEDEVAEALGAVPNDQGQYARYDLWKRVGTPEGPLVHALHHIGTTASAAHESSAVNAELSSMFVEAARWGRVPPDYIIRSHRHRSIAVDINTARGYGAAMVTPAWQGKTPFTWKVPGGRVSEPQFGGVLIRQGDEEFFYRRKVWTVDRSPEV